MQIIIALMTLSLLIIASAPTHASIGLFAAALIVIARLLQGFATGGQYAIATGQAAIAGRGQPIACHALRGG